MARQDTEKSNFEAMMRVSVQSEFELMAIGYEQIMLNRGRRLRPLEAVFPPVIARDSLYNSSLRVAYRR